MKKILIFMTVVLMSVACGSSPEKKAQKLITNYLKENLDNPTSYKPVSFGELEQAMVPDISGPEIVYEPRGWKMIHIYRAENKFGAIEKFEEVFYIDDDFTKVED